MSSIIENPEASPDTVKEIKNDHPASPGSSSEFSEVSINMKNRHPKILHPTLAFHEQRWKSMEKSSPSVLLPGYHCPSFHHTQAVMEDGETTKTFSNTNFGNNYVVLFFFPMDRSVDYSELMALKENLGKFEENNCQVVGVTSDSLIAILNWIKLEPNQGGTGGPVNFPIISDKTMEVAKMFGVKRPSGMPARATFILDKERIVRHSSIYPRVVGRPVDEILRTLQAIREVDLHASKDELDVVIPPGWKEGDDVIVNTEEGKKEYYSKLLAKKGEKAGQADGTENVDEMKTKPENKNNSITMSSGPEVSCPISYWFYKIPN